MRHDTSDRNHIMNVYVARYARELAALAWRGYQAHGVGVLAILADEDRRIYLPMPVFCASLVGVEPGHPMLRDLERYRPATQFVLSFGMTTWPTTIVTVITPRLSPPLAAKLDTQEQAA